MKLDISDDTLLQVSSIGAISYAAVAGLAPKALHEFHYKVATPFNPDQLRFQSIVGTSLGVQGLTLANDTAAGLTNQKKNTLKIHGATWLAVAALSAYHGQNGNLKKDVGLASAVGQGVLGGVMLLRGCRKA